MKSFLFFVITLSASKVGTQSSVFATVVWNVGQGQWITAVSPTHCRHFDMGGEFFPWEKVAQTCSGKLNVISLSHWDWDHIGALSKSAVKKHLRPRCLALPPSGESSERKKALIRELPLCPPQEALLSMHVWSPELTSKILSNALSHVIQYRGVLIPGDSTKAQENVWRHLPWVPQSRILILGHHGSATSSSQELLQSLSSVRLSVSSSRWARYRHPHSATLMRLRKTRLPVLRTEDWGHIWIEQRPHSEALTQ